MADDKLPSAGNLLGLIFARGAAWVLALLALGAAGAVWAQTLYAGSVKAQVDAGISPIEAKLDAHLKDAEGIKAEVSNLRQQMQAKEERDAERFDLLYRTILTGQPSRKAEALAQPSPMQEDGGP